MGRSKRGKAAAHEPSKEDPQVEPSSANEEVEEKAEPAAAKRPLEDSADEKNPEKKSRTGEAAPPTMQQQQTFVSGMMPMMAPWFHPMMWGRPFPMMEQQQTKEGDSSSDAANKMAALQQQQFLYGFVPPGISPMQAAQNAGMPPVVMTPRSARPPSKGVQLALACDADQLSEYQVLVRQQLELFEAGSEDVEGNTQGRKKSVVLGQVGLRCRHCAPFPLRARGRGAVYYPAKLSGIYQAAQNMAGSHLIGACQQLPQNLRDDIKKLRERRDNASSGKKYWSSACKAMGIYECETGLRMEKAPGQKEEDATGEASA